MPEPTDAYVTAAYEAHHAGLVRRLTAITRDAGDAEDLAHEAFLRLTSEARAGRPPDDPAAWLARVGWNLAMSRGRHRSVVDRRAGDLRQPVGPTSPDQVAIERENHARVAAALEALSSVERDALLLAAEGYRGQEVADRIGRSGPATRTLLCRVRAKLRTRLDREVLVAA